MSSATPTALIIDIDSPTIPHWLVDWAQRTVNTPTSTFNTLTLNASPASGYSRDADLLHSIRPDPVEGRINLLKHMRFIPFMVRQAHHERNKSTFSSLTSKLTGWLLTLLDNAIFQRNPFNDFALVSRTFLSATQQYKLGAAPDKAGSPLRIRISPQALATPAYPNNITIQSPILDALTFYRARLSGIAAFTVSLHTAKANGLTHTTTAQLSAQGPQSIWASYRLFHRRMEKLLSRAVQAALDNAGGISGKGGTGADDALPGAVPTLVTPTAPQSLAAGPHYYLSQVKSRLREGAQSWHVILARRNPAQGSTTVDLLEKATRFTLLPNPPGHFLADPFVVNANGQAYLFVEDYDYSLGRGIIACACLPPDEAEFPLDFKPVLRCDWHLSYPYVFPHEGLYYMVPEAAESGGVDLYQADEFPWRWRHVKRLIEGANIVDATLILEGGLWWLFAAIGEENTSTWDELFLYYAPSPQGPWQPHPQHPIKTDISSARPAGRPFWHDGRLLRPAQDCTQGYGSGLTLCEIVELTPTCYRERPYRHSRLMDAGSIGGTHTFNASERHIASDIRIKTKLTKPAHIDFQWVDKK